MSIDEGPVNVVSREVVAVNALSTSVVSLPAREKVVIHTLHRGGMNCRPAT
jgi:hypothetical protein